MADGHDSEMRPRATFKSFVDSTRVHAGEALAEELARDPDAASHVPLDLWREDLVGIKAHKKEKFVFRRP